MTTSCSSSGLRRTSLGRWSSFCVEAMAGGLMADAAPGTSAAAARPTEKGEKVAEAVVKLGLSKLRISG